MAYIYKITNDINNKIYIGKTEFSIEKRFKEHCKDAYRDRNENRPLYSAMRKYGVEHFHIDLIEKTDNPNEREIYWIEKYSSFKNGYASSFSRYLGKNSKTSSRAFRSIAKSFLTLANLRPVSPLCFKPKSSPSPRFLKSYSLIRKPSEQFSSIFNLS